MGEINRRVFDGAHAGGTEIRLLDAAERQFAAHGFAATSVRHITSAAGCNLAAVSYHFGSKLGLYAEVLRRRFAALRERRLAGIRAASGGAGSEALETVLRAFAVAFLEPLIADSHGRMVTQLLARELLDPQLPARMFWEEIAGPVQDALTGALVGAAPGLDEAKARFCVLSIIGQLVQAVHHWPRLEGEAVGGSGLTDLVDHVVEFSRAGVRACAKAGPRTQVSNRERRKGREQS